MKHKHYMVFISLLATLIILVLGLTACGSGGGGGENNNNDLGGGNPGIITGQAIKGPVSGGTVTAYTVTAGAIGAVLKTAVTDASGNYNLSIESYSGPVFLEITGGSYIDEATGATINLPTTPGSGLHAVVADVSPGGTLQAQITPLTTMAAALAQAKAGGLTALNISAASQQIGAQFGGLDVINTRPVNPLVSGSASGATQEAINYGLILGGISQQAKTLNISNPLDLITALAQDISDGTFNGQSGSTPVMLNGSSMEATTGTADLATALDAFGNDTTLNVSGGTVSTTLITLLQNPTVTTTVPGAPTGVSATAGDSQVTVSWNTVSGADSYNIYMASQSGITRNNYSTSPGGMKHIGVTSPFIHSGLTNGTTYFFVITAVNAGGEGIETNEVSATPATSVTTINAPNNLQATAISDTQVNLAWTDNSTNEDGFKIERKTGAGGIYSQISTVGTDITSYSDTAGLVANTVYCYQARTFNGVGNSGYSNESCVSTLSSGICTTCNKDTIDELWVAKYNGPDNLEDIATDVFVDSSINVYVTGSSAGKNTKKDFATVKYDSNGNQLWTKRYNSSDNLDDTPSDIFVDAAGNVYVTGSSTVKYDPNGNQLWAINSGGKLIVVDDAGNVYVVGNFAVGKYDPNGNQIWGKEYKGLGYAESKDMTIDSDGNIYITGFTYDPKNTVGQNNPVALTAKFNKDGLSWAQYYQYSYQYNMATAVAVDQDHNVYVAAYSNWTNGNADYDYVIIKYSPSGDKIWAKRYDSSYLVDDIPKDMVVDSSGNVYVTGTSGASPQQYSNWCFSYYTTAKYDSNGNQKWVDFYDTKDCADLASSIYIDSSGNVYVSGDSGTIKYDANGNKLESDKLTNILDFANKISADSAGNLYSIASDGDFVTTKYIKSSTHFTLNISKSGSGSGLITSLPTRISCGTNCSDTFVSGASVTLMAAADNDSTFMGWSGDSDCSDGKVIMNSDKDCMALFEVGTPPSAATGFMVTPGNGEVTISWDPVSGADSYNLYMASTSGVTKNNYNTLSDGNKYTNITSPYILTGLTDGKTYYFVITSVNVYGEGIESPEKSAAPGSTVYEAWVAQNNGIYQPCTYKCDALAVDNMENVYVAGKLPGSMGDIWDYGIVKYDSNGNQLWVARYNGPVSGADEVKAIEVDASGNVYVTGYSAGFREVYQGGGTRDFYDYATIKYDSDGNQLWVARYNNPLNGDDVATAMVLDTAGNIYVIGYGLSPAGHGEDIVTIKYDPNGNQLWAARYDGSNNYNNYGDAADAIVVDNLENVYVTGRSCSGLDQNKKCNKYDYVVIKYDSNGNQLWKVSWGSGAVAVGSDLSVDGSGNVYVTRSVLAYIYYDYVTAKYDTNGNKLWEKRYVANSASNSAPRITVDTSSNIFVIGNSSIIKYDTNGNEIWVGLGGSDLAVDTSGNVYVTGGDTIKYSANGNKLWGTRYNSLVGRNIEIDISGNVYVTGENSGKYITIKYTQ